MAICAYCQVPIEDPTTEVIHGNTTYCCANCATAMEQPGSGSDDAALRCAHCGVAIIDDSTMVSRGDAAFCCSNCAAVMQPG
jgi:DNA-directed RNA polymerase subunit RPC12/RpoP